MHILFVITRSDEIGGAHVHVRDLSLWLQKKGHEVTIIVGGNGFYLDQLRDLGLRVFSCPSLGRPIKLWRDLLALREIGRLVKVIRPDIVSTHSAKAGILTRIHAFSPLFPPTIFTAHGWSFTDGIHPFLRLIYKYLEKLLAISAKRVITVCMSDYYLAINNRVVTQQKLTCIYNGMPDLPAPLRQHNSPLEPLKLISVARFEPQKDHLTLLYALSALKNRPWNITLVGDGPQKSIIQRLAFELGLQDRVAFPGRCSNVHELLCQADLFILSSNWEGFPRSILEAMRASLPVIASDVGGVSESVQNGLTGFVTRPNDIESLINALTMYLDSPHLLLQHGSAGRRAYETYFEFSIMAEKTERLYQDVLVERK